MRRVAQTFYRYFGDSYDFLNIVATPSRFANRTHAIVRNDVDGIGLALSDQSAQFGSGGRLRGYSLFPSPGFYDGASTGYSHETGHQWINQLRFGAFAVGVPHWPVSTMATGTMGFSIGGAGGQGGDFRCKVVEENGGARLMAVPVSEAPVFNDFDLYLMGLMGPAGVQPQLVFPGVTAPPSCNGLLYTGTSPNGMVVIANLPDGGVAVIKVWKDATGKLQAGWGPIRTVIPATVERAK